MKWLKVTLDAKNRTIDDLAAALSALDIDGIEVEDYAEFCDFLETNKQYWDYVDDALLEQKRGVSRVIFYLPDTADGHAKLRGIASDLGDEPRVAVVDEDDWASSWQQYYKPTPIGERLLILPEWEPRPQTERTVFINNPGMSFGTGTHASTQIALEFVERTVAAGDTVLDLGCGSGILAICALLLGASNAIGIDIDPMAADISKKNAALNGVEMRYTAHAGNILSDTALQARLEGVYDAVYANIVADVILQLPAIVRRLLKPGGTFIVSGLIDTRADEVLNALQQHGFALSERKDTDGWVGALLRLIK